VKLTCWVLPPEILLNTMLLPEEEINVEDEFTSDPPDSWAKTVIPDLNWNPGKSNWIPD